MVAHYLHSSISSCQFHLKMRAGSILGVVLALVLLTIITNNAAALPYLNYSEDVPLFVQFFVIFMAIYHAAMFIMLKEIQKASPTPIWHSLSSANYLGIGLTLVTASLLCELHSASAVAHYILILAAGFDVATHYLANIVLYYLIAPIVKEKIEIFSEKYLLHYAFFEIVLYITANFMYNIKYPLSTHFISLLFFILFSVLIIIHYSSALLYISKGYSELGFVRKPFLIGGIGMISYLLSVSLIIYYIIHYLTPAAQKELYFYISFYAIFFVFTILYFARFVIEYPSLLQARWKVLMPFDIPKLAAAITLAFLATSFFFTTLEYPHLALSQTIPLLFVPVFLLPVFLGVIFTFTHLKLLSSRTKLKYWNYLAYGQYINVTVTFYLLSLIFLSWRTTTLNTKLFCACFGLASAAFYLFFALDLRTILVDQNIRPAFDRLDITRYLVSLSSWFILILLGLSISFEQGFASARIELISYPLILFFIAFFLIAFGAYLSVTHKGFEEILGKNIWSELSYIFAFVTFVLVYLIYSALGAQLQRFPYHNLAFVGYFVVLIIEIFSTRTLAEKFRYKKAREQDLGELLNFYAHNFLRTDYLEELWEKTVSRYVVEEESKKVGFDPARRRFDLEKVDEKTRLAVAVRMLLGMHAVPNIERMTLLRQSREETKAEILGILKEQVLLLPAELRSEFDERLYYPKLFERTINNLLTPLKTFVPLADQKLIIERLKRGEALFAAITFGETEISVQEGTRFSREEFLKLFQRYLEAIEERFPFKRFLLYELVREEIKEELELYGITVGDVLDRVPTGLEEMDKIMAGGVAKGSTTLLISEETKTKQKMLLSIIEQALLEGNIVLYATSKRPFHQIMGELLMAVEELKHLTILDFYEDLYAEEHSSETIEEGMRTIVPLNKILYQRSMVKVIKSHSREMPKVVIIDTFDDFSRYYGTHELFELLQKQLEGLKRWNCTSMIVLGPYSPLITREGVEEVKKHFDNVLILTGDEKESSVFIERLYHGTPTKHLIRLRW
jgi:KaiC/GvpD/RAD55 family RecA-like ATPase